MLLESFKHGPHTGHHNVVDSDLSSCDSMIELNGFVTFGFGEVKTSPLSDQKFLFIVVY